MLFNLNIGFDDIVYKDYYSSKMNKRYLTQCYYNLQEKYDCGGITEQEWNLIDNKYQKLIKEV